MSWPSIDRRAAVCALGFAIARSAAAAADTGCVPGDHLVCACEARGVGLNDPGWNACFLGDINHATLTQAPG